MSKQITPAILRRALDEEHRGEPLPARSVLRELLAKLASNGLTLTVVERRRTDVLPLLHASRASRGARSRELQESGSSPDRRATDQDGS